MDKQRIKKVAKWGGIGLAGLVLITAGTVATIFFSAGSRFEGRLEGLVPQRAVLLLRFNQLGAQLSEGEDTLQSELQGFLGQPAMSRVGASPIYREAMDMQPQQIWEYKLDPMLNQLRASLASMPMSMSLEEDVLAEQTMVAMLPNDSGDGLDTLLITRISSDLAGAWEFSGFATGDHGNSTITFQGDLMEIAIRNEGEAEPSRVYLALFDDVLLASASMSAVNDALGLRAALMGAESYLTLELFEQAESELAKTTDGKIDAFSNLDALRAYQGVHKDDLDLPKKDQRAPIDRYFSLPPSVIQLSPMLLPTIDDVLSYTIDTRAFGMAAWNFDLSNEGELNIHQHLIVNPDRLKDEDLKHLKEAWSQGSQAWNFLNFLPEETWFIGSAHQELDRLAADIQPVKNAAGEDEASAVYSMLKAIAKRGNSRVDSVGVALLPTNSTYWANPGNPRERELVAQGIVSKASFPPFVFFMHWPSATNDDVLGLMREQLAIQGIASFVPVERNLNGNRVVLFDPVPGQNPPAWVTKQLACGVIDDYMVICLSKNLRGMADMFDKSASLRKQSGNSFDQAADEGYAMMYLRPSGFEQFSRIVAWSDSTLDPDHPERAASLGKAISLGEAIAESKFNTDFPFEMYSQDFRKSIAAKYGVNEQAMGRADQRVTAEYNAKIEEWKAKREPYAAEVTANIRMATAIKDFLAVTQADTEVMHTHFVIRLADQ